MKDIKFAQKKALEALNWISKCELRLSEFLEINGASVDDVFKRANEPEFLVFIMEYCLSTDEIAIECARELLINPEELQEIRNLLPGGEVYNWI